MQINCKGKLIDLSIPKIMGILNFTPDSFFDGGKYKSDTEILSQVEKMLNDGADFIDVGTYSTRPGAAFVSVEEESNRTSYIIPLLIKNFPDIIISIDTFRSDVARIALQEGSAIVNDISAGCIDPEIIDVVAQFRVPYIMMHMKGTPQNMQDFTQYDDILLDMMRYFSERISIARNKGISDLIIDLGFGFSKTLDQNYFIMKNLEYFSELGLPNLVGISRKSMIYKALDIEVNQALNGTSVLNTIALSKGANILRVHDVLEAKQALDLYLRCK